MSSLHSRQTSEISQFSGFINVTAWAVHLPFQPSCRLVLSGTVYRKISETVVLWKLSDANLKLTCLSVHFLHRLVSRAHETSLAYIRRVTKLIFDWLIDCSVVSSFIPWNSQQKVCSQKPECCCSMSMLHIFCIRTGLTKAFSLSPIMVVSGLFFHSFDHSHWAMPIAHVSFMNSLFSYLTSLKCRD